MTSEEASSADANFESLELQSAAAHTIRGALQICIGIVFLMPIVSLAANAIEVLLLHKDPVFGSAMLGVSLLMMPLVIVPYGVVCSLLARNQPLPAPGSQGDLL